MIVQAQLSRNPGGYPPPRCQVDKVVELPAGEFDDFLRNPLRDKAFITENKEVMFNDGRLAHCLLVLGRDRRDGVLVEMEAHHFAKYTLLPVQSAGHRERRNPAGGGADRSGGGEKHL